MTVDADLVVRTWDGWLETNTGIAAGDARGRPVAEVIPDLAARGLLQRFEQVLVTGEVQVLAPAFHHYLVPCPPREPSRYFDRMQQRVTLGPVREGDVIAGVMATVEDVTARIDREREMAEGLRADDWKVRRAAVAGLSRDAHPDLLLSLLASLRTEHRDFNVLSSALQLLGASDVDLTGPLVALMHDPDPGLRMQVALALGERQTPGAVEALIGALEDPDVNVRFHAIEALGRMRAGDAVDALADIAESDDFFLVFPAVDALARIYDARVVPRLIPLLRRTDIIEPVADALGELGGAEAVAPLVGVLNTTGPAAPIARALARVYDRYEQHYAGGAVVIEEFQAAIAPVGSQRVLDAVSETGSDDLPSLVTVLAWLRGAAVERALAHLLGHAAVRSAVIEAIVRRDASAGIVEILVEQLRGEDADVRLAAIVALGRLGDRRATAALSTALDGPRAGIVAAAAALAQIGDPSAFEPLLPLLAHDDAAVRQAAIGALNSLGHPEMAARVAGLLSSPDPHVRESAVRIAGYFGYRACVDSLIDRSSDQDERVRRAAVEHLPFLEDPRTIRHLAAALDDPSPRVRSAAAQALSHLPAAAARGPLLSATRDADAWVRYYAVRSLGEVREPSAVPRLSELAASDPAMHVRIAALETIGAIDGPTAIDTLLPYVADEHADLAAAALRALGEVCDDRAAAALKGALRSPDAIRAAGRRDRAARVRHRGRNRCAGLDGRRRCRGRGCRRRGRSARRDCGAARRGLGRRDCRAARAHRRSAASPRHRHRAGTAAGAARPGRGRGARPPAPRRARGHHRRARPYAASGCVGGAAHGARRRGGGRPRGRRHRARSARRAGYRPPFCTDGARGSLACGAAGSGRGARPRDRRTCRGRGSWGPVTVTMAMHSDILGLSSSALPLLRDLIHERLGLFYDNSRLDTLADRLSPLVVERGFDSFLDYYYLLKYDEQAAEEWGRVMDALSVPETYFWREIDQVQAVADHIVPALMTPGTGDAAPHLERALRDGGGAADHRDGAGGSGALRARRDRDPRQRREPGGDREGAGGPLPRARVPQPSAALREKYFSRDGDAWAVSPALHRRVTSWSVVNVLCEGDVAAHARAPIVFCRNVFIYFSPAVIAQGRRSVRPRHADPRVPVSGRIRIAPADADAVRARGDRRRVRVREAVRSRREGNGCLRSSVCWSSTTPPTCGRS